MNPDLPIGGLTRGYQRGLIVEYAATLRPLILSFLFNPSTISRTRSTTVTTGGGPAARGGYSFASPDETPRASQGASSNAESISFTILLDATDRMNTNDPVATTLGVQPEIDVIRTMLEPKSTAGQGELDLGVAAETDRPAFSTHEVASVLLFKWGLLMLPVFMTQAQIQATEFLPTLFPYRAEAALTLQVIETDNPIYKLEKIRQQQTARSYSSLAGLPSEILRF